MYREEIMEIYAGLKPGHSLTTFLKCWHPHIYSAIQEKWNSEYYFPPNRFVDAIQFYVTGETFICPHGKHKKIEKLFGPVICTIGCQCTVDKKNVTMISLYGSAHAMQCEQFVAKAENTWLEKYGVSKLGQTSVDKRAKTMIERYGAKTPLESKMVRDKGVATCVKNSGVEYPFQSKKIQERIQQDWLERTNGEKKSYVKTEEQWVEIRKSCRNFENVHILDDVSLFCENLKTMSRQALADHVGCSLSLIDKTILEYDLDEFRGQASYYEVVIGEFLKELGVEYDGHNRKLICPKEVDFFIPSKFLAIEFDGLHWHSELLGKKDKHYHLTKTNLVDATGNRLIHIFQDEWDTKLEIVKSIIRNYLGINTAVVYGRKCSIEKISDVRSKLFLEDNHIQSYSIGCFVNYGLTHNDEIIAIMTFKKTANGVELSRFCNKINTSVVGGANKLFAAYINEYGGEDLYTYSDKRYFTGDIYLKLGFVKVGETPPNYWYFKKANKKYHRLNFTKKKLVKEGFDPSKTEWEIMQEAGYDRIWDCGSNKYVYEGGAR